MSILPLLTIFFWQTFGKYVPVVGKMYDKPVAVMDKKTVVVLFTKVKMIIGKPRQNILIVCHIFHSHTQYNRSNLNIMEIWIKKKYLDFCVV